MFFHRYIMGPGIGRKKWWSPNGWITSRIHKCWSRESRIFEASKKKSPRKIEKPGPVSRFHRLHSYIYIYSFLNRHGYQKLEGFFLEWELQVQRIHGFSKWWRVNYSDTQEFANKNVYLQHLPTRDRLPWDVLGSLLRHDVFGKPPSRFANIKPWQ